MMSGALHQHWNAQCRTSAGRIANRRADIRAWGAASQPAPLLKLGVPARRQRAERRRRGSPAGMHAVLPAICIDCCSQLLTMGKREGKEAAQEGRTKPKRPLLEAQPDSAFARALGSTDFHTREAGLAAVTHWLAKRSDLAELDALKLWKGIFYAYWHSDKSPVQASRELEPGGGGSHAAVWQLAHAPP